MNRCRMLAAVGALSLLVVACGSDDEDDSTASSAPTPSVEATTAATAETTAATTADTTAATTADTAGSELTELCALATEMFDQDSPPTAEQLTTYLEIAPDEIREDVEAAATPLLEVEEGDMVSFFNVVADDEVEQHLDAIDAFEEENCGIPHSEDSPLAEGASQEVEEDAARVDVIGRDYEFEFDSQVEPGRTSFVFTNEGEEAHFLLVVKLAEGVTMQQALESEDPTGLIEGEWETKLAAGGGDDEAITFDLEAGNYGMACFVPAADGTPHAFLGMTAELTVG